MNTENIPTKFLETVGWKRLGQPTVKTAEIVLQNRHQRHQP